MSRPTIRVLGAYRLALTKELFQKQFDLLYGYKMSLLQRILAKRQCKKQLKSVALIEVLVENCDGQFNDADFTQRQAGVPRDWRQAPWGGVYLSPDGDSALALGVAKRPDDGTFRYAFFLHFYQPGKPLLTPYGRRKCPTIGKMPGRLRTLVPFMPVD